MATWRALQFKGQSLFLVERFSGAKTLCLARHQTIFFRNRPFFLVLEWFSWFLRKGQSAWIHSQQSIGWMTATPLKSTRWSVQQRTDRSGNGSILRCFENLDWIIGNRAVMVDCECIDGCCDECDGGCDGGCEGSQKLDLHCRQFYGSLWSLQFSSHWIIDSSPVITGPIIYFANSGERVAV